MKDGVFASLVVFGTLTLLVAAALASPIATDRPGAVAAPAVGLGVPQTWTTGSTYASNGSVQEYTYAEVTDDYSSESLTITAQNTSSTTVAVETLESEVSESYFLQCAPSCSAPISSLLEQSNENYSHGIFENFTTGATVDANGSYVAALGLLNASEQLEASGGYSLSESGPGSNNTTGTVAFSGRDVGTISFPGALGILPLTTPSGPGWNDTAAYRLAVALNLSVSGTGAFANGSAYYNLSGPGATFSGPELVGPPGGLLGLSISCPVNASGGSEWGTSAGNCSYAGGGNETEYGFNVADYFNISSSPPGSPAPPAPAAAHAPIPWNFSFAILEFDGPYVPGPALSEVLAGSAFFGGALRNWTEIDVGGYGSYGSSTGLGTPGTSGNGTGVGGGGGLGAPGNQRTTPTGPPPNATGHGGTTPLSPTQPASRPADPMGMLPLVLLVMVGVVLAAVGVAWYSVRRGRRPRSGP